MKIKKQAYTLLETLIVVGIISILSIGSISGIRIRVERNALQKIRNELPVFLDNLAYNAMQYGEAGTIDFDFENYVISYREKKYHLPKTYSYFRKKGSSEKIKKFQVELKNNGNISDMFLIFVTDKKEKKALYRLGLYNTSVLRYLKIRRFRPKKKEILLSDSKYYDMKKWKEEI